jgi:hypothetical protein
MTSSTSSPRSPDTDRAPPSSSVQAQRRGLLRADDLRAVTDQAALGIALVDAEGVRFANPAMAELTGCSVEELLSFSSDDFVRLVHPEDLAAVVAERRRPRLTPAEVRNLEYRLITRTGAVRWVSQRSWPAGGVTPHTLVFTLLDVTEHKRAEHELRQLWRAVEEAPVSIVITDRDGRIEYVNPAFTRTTGYSAAEARGQNPRILHSGKTPPETYATLWETVLAGREWRGEFVNRKKDGGEYVEDARIAAVRDERGEISHFVAVKQDVTSEREARGQLTALNADLEQRVADRTRALERASRAKDDFLSSMSHELRTPLNGVLGLSEALQDGIYGPLNERQRGALHRIEESGGHLLALINDILDISKLDAGAVSLTLTPTSLDEVCRQSLRFVQEAGLRKGLRFAVSIGEVGMVVLADERRLAQMVVNLLGNAVKFTPEGGSVCLEVSAPAGSGEVRVAVRDTGIGISAEQLPRLFQRFVQLDGSLARQHNGSGLGLALTQRLAALHGGRVEVASEPGAGSCFTLILPRAATP